MGNVCSASLPLTLRLMQPPHTARHEIRPGWLEYGGEGEEEEDAGVGSAGWRQGRAAQVEGPDVMQLGRPERGAVEQMPWIRLSAISRSTRWKHGACLLNCHQQGTMLTQNTTMYFDPSHRLPLDAVRDLRVPWLMPR